MEWMLVGAFGLFWIGGIALWIFALVDCIRVQDDSMYRSGTKLIWIIDRPNPGDRRDHLPRHRSAGARHETARRRHATTSATAHDLTTVLGPDRCGC